VRHKGLEPLTFCFGDTDVFELEHELLLIAETVVL
jgi:hypothetical protein